LLRAAFKDDIAVFEDLIDLRKARRIAPAVSKCDLDAGLEWLVRFLVSHLGLSL
jgi:hypothetical protein